MRDCEMVSEMVSEMISEMINEMVDEMSCISLFPSHHLIIISHLVDRDIEMVFDHPS